jgi:hypothetical protein
MYRDNEAARVSEVLAARQAGDGPALVTAATRLWQLPVEAAASAADGDEAAREVWQAIDAAKQVPAAVAAGLALIRARQLLRPSAFLDVIEQVSEPAALLELATVVQDAGWPSYPYLATIFLWLIELGQEDALWAYIKAHRERLAAATPSWTLVGFILSTSRIGDRHDVAAWFRDCEQRADVPMWLIASYIASLLQLADVPQLIKKIAVVARAAWASARHDAAAPLIMATTLLEDLDQARDDEFLARYRDHGALLTTSHDVMAHPIVTYVNGVKRRSPIRAEDFAFSLANVGARVSMARLVAEGAKGRPVNWRTTELIKELPAVAVGAARYFPILVRMLETPARDPQAVAIYIEMRRAKLIKGMPRLVPAWRRIVKAKISWLRLIHLDYLGG